MSGKGQPKTAFVFAGGGSLGAIQVGMLHSLAKHGVAADMACGSSVGAVNAAYYAGDPTIEGIRKLEAIWRGLRRQDVFPISLGALFGFLLLLAFPLKLLARELLFLPFVAHKIRQ